VTNSILDSYEWHNGQIVNICVPCCRPGGPTAAGQARRAERGRADTWGPQFAARALFGARTGSANSGPGCLFRSLARLSADAELPEGHCGQSPDAPSSRKRPAATVCSRRGAARKSALRGVSYTDLGLGERKKLRKPVFVWIICPI